MSTGTSGRVYINTLPDCSCVVNLIILYTVINYRGVATHGCEKYQIKNTRLIRTGCAHECVGGGAEASPAEQCVGVCCNMTYESF